MPIQDDWNELLNIREKALSTIKHQTIEEKYLLLLAVRVTELCIDAITLLEEKRSAALPIILRSAIEAYIHLLKILQEPLHIETMKLSFNYDMHKFLENVKFVNTNEYRDKKKGPHIKELFNNVSESITYLGLYAHLCMHSHSNISALVTSHSIDGKILLGTTQNTDFIKLHTLIVVTLFADTLKDTLNQFNHDRKAIENIETIIERINNDPFMVKFHDLKKTDSQGIYEK
ncbi:MAG: hypothetical protein FJY09_00835 [Chlorobi bacterium]|nr:hypothetical protein [Chlorobiota bacterium]